MKAFRRYSVRTVLPEALEPLGALANNLRWAWHPPTRDLFARIDPQRFEAAKGDPVRLLSKLSGRELEHLAADENFVAQVTEAHADLTHYLTEPRWYQQWAPTAAGGAPRCIAYFSPEFGITSVLPQYSGGLGILAGDHLKSASDLGVPIVGVGLYYQTGYFVQSLSRDGWQQETYPLLDPNALPLSLLREPDGSPATIELALPGGRTLRAYIWIAQVGRVPLLILDSNVPGNDEVSRRVTAALYGGGGDQRLEQELLLGIGGVRALRTYARLTGMPAPDVYHTNEGHAGFLGVERISELVQEHGLTFDEALVAVRAATVFTTHTPVPAGIDRFGAEKIRHYFGGSGALPGVPVERLMQLGAEDYPGGTPGIFNMAVMGLRLAQRANGVSRLHGTVSREMFDGLWVGFDHAEVPITSITNGVHAPTWAHRKVFEITEQHLGSTDLEAANQWNGIYNLPWELIWHTKREMREELVLEARRRMRRAWRGRGASDAELGWTDEILDPDVLTIGFARRVPTYKRLTLMLRDPRRLKALLLDKDRPVQIVIAGKSHPADDTGKRLIQQMVHFADDPQVRHRIAFLPNYDIGMALYLYPGCDVWLNNPLRPFEACGTSGMKAALNGGLNLSILDGWWDEWYDGDNGWAIPTADGVSDPDRRDDIEAKALYDLIEHHVAPSFYNRDENGLPPRWLEMVTHTLATLSPKVLATRMVREYTERLYLPGAQSGWALAGDRGGEPGAEARRGAARRAPGAGWEGAKSLAAYRGRVLQGWSGVRLRHIDQDEMSDTPQIGDTISLRAYVELGMLTPRDVEVQAVFGRALEDDEIVDISVSPMSYVEETDDGLAEFAGTFALNNTGPRGYTVRVVPKHPHLASAAELGVSVDATSTLTTPRSV